MIGQQKDIRKTNHMNEHIVGLKLQYAEYKLRPSCSIDETIIENLVIMGDFNASFTVVQDEIELQATS